MEKKFNWLSLVGGILGLVAAIMLFIPVIQISAGGMTESVGAFECFDSGATELILLGVAAIICAVVGLLLLVFGLLGAFGVVKKAGVANMTLAIIGLVFAVIEIVLVILIGNNLTGGVAGVSIIPLSGIITAVMFVAYIIAAIAFKFAKKK